MNPTHKSPMPKATSAPSVLGSSSHNPNQANQANRTHIVGLAHDDVKVLEAKQVGLHSSDRSESNSPRSESSPMPTLQGSTILNSLRSVSLDSSVERQHLQFLKSTTNEEQAAFARIIAQTESLSKQSPSVPLGSGSNGLVVSVPIGQTYSSHRVALKTVSGNYQIDGTKIMAISELPYFVPTLCVCERSNRLIQELGEPISWPSLRIDASRESRTRRRLHKDLAGIAIGLSQLNNLGIVYLDLKPENLLRHNGQVKLIDYDATATLIGGRINLGKVSTQVDDSRLRAASCGASQRNLVRSPRIDFQPANPSYGAPEVQSQAIDIHKTDSWSFGMLMLDLLSRSKSRGNTQPKLWVRIFSAAGAKTPPNPFSMHYFLINPSVLLESRREQLTLTGEAKLSKLELCDRFFAEFIDNTPTLIDAERDLLKSLLRYNPKNRLSTSEILSHPVFAPITDFQARDDTKSSR